LEQINCSFYIDVSDIEEIVDPHLSPADVACSLAKQKARDVASRHAQSCIIGADTIVVHQNQILGKPQNKQEAIDILTSLSNQEHEVITGVALLLTDHEGTITESCTFAEHTTVRFGSLETSEIKEYVASGSPMDKAGAYGIQDDWGALFVKEINGDYNNVVGFPLYTFYQQMKSFAPDLLPHPQIISSQA
jgi:septum formation protein